MKRRNFGIFGPSSFHTVAIVTVPPYRIYFTTKMMGEKGRIHDLAAVLMRGRERDKMRTRGQREKERKEANEEENEKGDRLLNEAMHLHGRRARDSSPEASVP